MVYLFRKSIRNKLLLIPAIACILIGGIVFTARNAFLSEEKLLTNLSTLDMPKVRAINKLFTFLSRTHMQILDLLIKGNQNVFSEEKLYEQGSVYIENLHQIKSGLQQIKTTYTFQELESVLLNNVETELANYHNQMLQVLTSITLDNTYASKQLSKAYNSYGLLNSVFLSLNEEIDFITNKHINNSIRDLNKNSNQFYILAFFTLFILLFISWSLAKRITEPILKLLKITDRISDEFNYSLRVSELTPDEIGQFASHFNQMLEKIEEQNQKIISERSRLKTIFENVVDGVLTATETTSIDSVNPAIERMFGYTPSELIGQPLNLLIAEDSYSDQLWHATHFIKNGKSIALKHDLHISNISEQLVGKHKDGSTFPLQIDISRIDTEKKVAYTAVFKNISKQIEIQKLLEEEIKKRTETTEQIMHVQKIDSIGVLAGGIAHDFNNLLVPILGYSAMIQHHLPPHSPVQKNVLQIIDSATKAKELVAQILLFSRKSETTKEFVNLQDLVNDALSLLKETIKKEVSFHYLSNSEGMYPAYIDRNQFYQIIMNLCINASQAMSGAGTVHILLKKETHTFIDESGEKITGPFNCLTVKDNGHGMKKEVLERIYEPFFTTKGEGIGTGLGLSVVHGIVRQHGGNIICESEIGRGTEFNIYLPLSDKPPEKLQGPLAQERKDMEVVSGTEHILLVDDKSEVLEFTKLAFEDGGYQVSAYQTPNKAFQYFVANFMTIDILVTDYSMPITNGVTLIKKIRTVKPTLPCIIVTGNKSMIKTEPETIIDAILEKPYRPYQLSKIVRDVLDGKNKDRSYE